MSYVAGQRCDVCGGESPYVPICGECEIAERADVQQDRQARTIRRLRALADGYRAAWKAERDGRHRHEVSAAEAWSKYREVKAGAGVCAKHHTQGAAEERARIVARLRDRAASWRNGGSVSEELATELAHVAELLESEEP